jgi:site-specific recombinase XerD
MASLKRISNSPYWIACFRKANGKSTCRSTKIEATEKKYQQAYNIAVAFEEAYRATQVIGHAGKVLAEIAKEISSGSDSLRAIEFSNEWYSNASRTLSKGTVAVYRTPTTRWVDWLAAEGLSESHIGQITRQHIVAFRNHCADTWGPGPSTSAVGVVRQILESAVLGGTLQTNVANKIDKIADEENDFEREPFTPDDLQALWQAADDKLEWRTMLMLGLYTGQRLVDLARLRWSSIDLEAGEIRIKTGKTQRRQTNLIPTPLANWLQAIQPKDLDPEELVSPSFEGTRGTTLSKMFLKIMSKAEISPRIVRTAGRDRKTKSFHSLRHTLPSMLARQGAAPKTIQEIVGHSSASTTAHYTHAERDQIEQALAGLHDPFST